MDRVYTTQDGLASTVLLSLFQSADGRLWAGLGGGLAEIIPNEQDNGVTFRNFAAGSGLGDEDIWALNADRDGNLWAGSERNGAFKIARNGFATYTEADEMRHPHIASIFANHAGDLYIVAAARSGPVTMAASRFAVSRFDGKRFISLWPAFPPAINDLGWGPARIWQDRQGEWWFGTGQGLARFPRTQNFEQLQHTRPKAIYTI